MSRPWIWVATGVMGVLFPPAGGFAAEEAPKTQDPESASGLDFYCQGGVVLEGVAYFTSTDGSRRPGVHKSPDFHSVVTFGLRDFRKRATYPFARTYDSSPFLIQKKDGTWLVLAHEHKKARTVAINRDTGAVEWISAANQPGAYFFGYSYFRCEDDTKIILTACANGLHAISSENGRDVWWVKQASTGGVTPCVDQKNGWVFYQCDAKVLKLRAVDGEILGSVKVDSPNRCISWNTVLVDDPHGYFVATRWYGAPEWDSAIRVYDKNLKMAWERKALPSGKKDTLTYADGKLVTGSGNGWSKKYTGDKWKYIAAYSIATGKVIWKCDLSGYPYRCIINVPFYSGFFYAETQDGPPGTSRVFRIEASGGKIAEVLDYGRPITSCAPCIIAHGKILSGDLWEDRIVVTRIAENSSVDWPGPFGDPQTNQNAAAREPRAKLVPMHEIAHP